MENNKNCEICGKRLVGKQTRFCGILCRNKFAGRKSTPRYKLPDKEWLKKEYLLPPAGKGRTQKDLAKEFGVTRNTISVWLDKLGIKIDANQRLGYFRRIPKFTITKEWLYEEYIVNDKSMRELSRMIGSSTLPIKNNLNKFGIHKPIEQLAKKHSKRMSGKNNPAYTNGNSQNYVKRMLKKAKLQICEWCGTNKNVQIHHIDHNRENNVIDNVMWLCHRCNVMEASLFDLKNSGRANVTIDEDKIIIEFDRRKPKEQ